MTAIRGRSLESGVVIAAGAVIRAATGIGGVSPDILQHGVDALRKQLPPQDYPEVIAVCDTVATGLTMKIPGINTVGIAAESDAVPENIELDVPCVVGLRNLLEAVSAGDIIVLDGDKGTVQIDPDPKTLIAYQQRHDAQARRQLLFIESRHLPAKTQAGDTVLVYARTSDEEGLAQAVENGADGLLVEPFEPYGRECYEAILKIALGKPTAILAGSADKDLLRAAARLACPGQVTVLFPAHHFAALSRRMAEAIEHVVDELVAEDLDPPRVAIGALARTGPDAPDQEHEPVFHLVDLRSLEAKSAEVGKTIGQWVSALAAERAAFDLGNRTRRVRAVVKAGARSLVTTPELVAKVKDTIRTVGMERTK